MNTIPIVAFSAWSGTGKTTLIEALVSILTRQGLRVAVIKHDAHRFEIDREGKDSWRFTKAGAAVSMVSSAEKTAVIEQRPLAFPELTALVHDVDFVLVEGFKSQDLTRIGISRKATGKGFPAPVEAYAAVVTDDETVQTDLPRFDLEDQEGLARFLLDNRDRFTQIPARTTRAAEDAEN